MVIYQPGPRIVAPTLARPPMYLYTPRPRPRPEWGLNLHLQGGPMGSKYSGESAHMEGGGAGLRFRPHPIYALEADLDFYGGRDYNDFTRKETAFTLNNYFFLNPRDRLQVYLLAGFGWSAATANDNNRAESTYNTYHYDYFGAFGGIGLEWRLGHHVALNADGRGFIRGRIDDHGYSDPEFVSSTGQASNTSAGVLFTGGITFYF